MTLPHRWMWRPPFRSNSLTGPVEKVCSWPHFHNPHLPLMIVISKALWTAGKEWTWISTARQPMNTNSESQSEIRHQTYASSNLYFYYLITQVNWSSLSHNSHITRRDRYGGNLSLLTLMWWFHHYTKKWWVDSGDAIVGFLVTFTVERLYGTRGNEKGSYKDQEFL